MSVMSRVAFGGAVVVGVAEVVGVAVVGVAVGDDAVMTGVEDVLAVDVGDALVDGAVGADDDTAALPLPIRLESLQAATDSPTDSTAAVTPST
jgi:hypothetical protein